MAKGDNIYPEEALKFSYDNDTESLSTSLPNFAALLINGVVTANNTGVSEPLFVGPYRKKTIYVSSSSNCNFYILLGPVEDLTFLLKSGSNCDTEDSDRVWNCNNETISFQVDEQTEYISIVADEVGGADSDVIVYSSGG